MTTIGIFFLLACFQTVEASNWPKAVIYYENYSKVAYEYNSKIYYIRVPNNIIELEYKYMSESECFSYCNLIRANIMLTKLWQQSIY